MIKQKTVIASFIVLFVWVEVAQAASISTRVRILESKVSKFDRKIQAESAARKAYEHQVNEKLGTVDDLQKQVTKIVQEMEAKKKANGQDSRYAFP
ncbi:hypothetical protein QCB44_02595 [Thiomicrorhabdus sp. zzn3]|uniref:hypothetical protein n=1 Tax=Thiomicrorhabdus sp. zzn3 TaxID=3039775 RepID=UPI002436E5D5|nr:hypothetical protein [Thiomicrorhabdus sp. zzn3]MDG6777587.1 hypothetical protein [Thiomicrorhabdus sp. zzn3]